MRTEAGELIVKLKRQEKCFEAFSQLLAAGELDTLADCKKMFTKLQNNQRTRQFIASQIGRSTFSVDSAQVLGVMILRYALDSVETGRI